jgi:outer membrane receptor protein involved in Fe transport
VPGVQATSQGSPTVSIRGSGQADRVLLLTEGVPLNLADGLGAAEILIPYEMIGGETIVAGPASVDYGTAALAGVVDHRLRRIDQPLARVSVTDDTSWLGERSALVATPWSTGQASLYSSRDPGRYAYTSVDTGASGRRQNSTKEITRATALDEESIGAWTVSSFFLIGHEWSESDNTIQQPIAGTTDIAASLASISGVRDFKNTSGVRTQHLALRVTDIREWGLYDNGLTDQSTSFTNRTALNADLTSDLTNSLQSHTFSDFDFNQYNSSLVNSGANFRDDTLDVGESFHWAATDTLNVKPTLRMQTNTGAWLQSLALNQALPQFQALQKLQVWWTYAEGYRRPSLNDRFANTSYFVGNPALQPERSRSYETGASFENGKRRMGYLDGYAARASVYATDYSSFFQTVSLSTSGLATKTNNGSAHVEGVSFAAEYGVRVFNFSVTYNHLNSHLDTSNEPLTLAPDDQYTLTASQQLGPIVMLLRETICSHYFLRDTNNALHEMPSWNTLDFELHSMGFTHWQWQAGVLNLFDRAREFTFGFPEKQRSVYLAATRLFD